MTTLNCFRPRHLPIAACLWAAFASSATAAAARRADAALLPHPQNGRAVHRELPLHFVGGLPNTPWESLVREGRPISIQQVTNCDDDGPGSLRAEVAAAVSGDTIDLSQMGCSTITLGSEIKIYQDNLRLMGPGADQLTIDGNAHSRIFDHQGNGTLNVYDMSIVNGYSTSGGGCLVGRSVSLIRSTVSHCRVVATGALGQQFGGGGISSTDLALDNSEISFNYVQATTNAVSGGGIYVSGNFTAKYSTISNNVAYSANNQSRGGGIRVGNEATIQESTISRNRSAIGGGIYFYNAAPGYSGYLANSTISSNVATSEGAGVVTLASIRLFNSTVVLNATRGARVGSGLLSKNVNATFALYSSIVAGNGGSDGPGDIGAVDPATPDPTAQNNIVVSSTFNLPADTIRACPRIEPLANNGGPTLTHALAHDSPGIDHGFNPRNLLMDQRLALRAAGMQTDIGSVERQASELDERIFISGFDGLCDQ